MSILTPPIVKNNHVFLEFYLSFWIKVLDQTCESFNIKFRPQWKDQENSYQVRTFLAVFVN